jgi:hypothetical protein
MMPAGAKVDDGTWAVGRNHLAASNVTQIVPHV